MLPLSWSLTPLEIGELFHDEMQTKRSDSLTTRQSERNNSMVRCVSNDEIAITIELHTIRCGQVCLRHCDAEGSARSPSLNSVVACI